MSNIVDLLIKQAEQIKADDLESTIRSSVKDLMSEGIPFEKAASLVEKEVENLEDSLMAQILEKAASYINELEDKVSELQAKINERDEGSDIHIKLASAGFTEDEIQVLQSSPSLMDKVASATQEPWSLGQGAGVKREKTDPLLEFILS